MTVRRRKRKDAEQRVPICPTSGVRGCRGLTAAINLEGQLRILPTIHPAVVGGREGGSGGWVRRPGSNKRK